MQNSHNTDYQRAAQLLADGQASAAQSLLLSLLKSAPNNSDALALLGHSLQRQGKLAEAVVTFEQLTQLDPQCYQSFAELAAAYLANQQTTQAKQAYQQALKLNPQYSEGWLYLGNLLMQLDDKQQAHQCFIQSERCDPMYAQLSAMQQAFLQQQFHQAEQLARSILQQHSFHPQALHQLAVLAEQQGLYEEAISLLKRGLQYAPFHKSLWELLIKNLVQCGHQQEAINAAQQLVGWYADNWHYHKLLAVELANGGQFSASLVAYDEAIKRAPQNANLHLLRGHVLKTLGKRQACEQAYRRSLALEKVNGTAYWALADLKSYCFSADDRQHMQTLLNDPEVNPAQAAQAGFALAKSCEDQGDFAQAFAIYQRANQLRPDKHFVPADYAQSCQAVCQGFSSGVVVHQAKVDKQQAIPIFIVGLTRSGSTLLEQMLASHSAVEGTMELYCLPRTVRRAQRLATQKGLDYPQVMASLSTAELRALGQSYLDESAIYRSGKPYFIDKMPPNFHNVGFIHMILPQAIVIDARRHPLAAGLSNYKQHFARGYDFSYQLEDIGFYYNQYLAMMDHWDEVLPGKVLCMQYEEVVRDTEPQLRRLLHHCGLPYEPACLDFHTNRRAVRTASSEQVRQPIYQQGIEQWRHFEEFLQPLKSALGEQTLQRFAQFL